jgi:CO/xanthine dehydrogenase Mo-binding subunit
VRAEGGPADRLAGDAGTPAVRVHATHRVGEEGTLLAVRVELVVDGGADPAGAEPLLDELCRSVVGPYRCENVDIQGWVVRTHNPPAGPWPGGAAMVAAVVAEAQIDAAAAACGRGPLDLRVKNLIRSGDHLPDGRRLAGAVPLPELLTAVLDTQMPPFPPGPDIRTFPGTVGRTGELTRVRRGAGIALAMVDLVPPELDEEFASAQVALTSDVNGPIVHVATSMVDTGNGQHALLRKMAREVLGVRRVIVRRPANPADLPATAIGPGRTTWLHCMAVQRAARAARAQALAKIAAQFAVSPQLLEVRDGMVVTYDGTLSKPVEEVYAQVLRGAAVYVANGEFRVHGSGAPSPGVFVPEPGTAHVAVAAYRAVVDADTELHTLRPVRVTAAHDAGRVLLPERAEAAVGSGVLTAVDFVFNAQAEEVDLAGAELGGFGALGPGQFPTMLEQPELELLPFLESSIGELDSTMLRRRGFAAPLPLGYLPVRRAAYAACAAALACATRDALEAHPTRMPLRPWGVSG